MYLYCILWTDGWRSVSTYFFHNLVPFLFITAEPYSYVPGQTLTAKQVSSNISIQKCWTLNKFLMIKHIYFKLLPASLHCKDSEGWRNEKMNYISTPNPADSTWIISTEVAVSSSSRKLSAVAGTFPEDKIIAIGWSIICNLKHTFVVYDSSLQSHRNIHFLVSKIVKNRWCEARFDSHGIIWLKINESPLKFVAETE